MRKLTLTHPIRQLFLAMAGFAVAIALIECDGLASWANHLELGPLRTAAVPVTRGMRWAVGWTGAGRVRAGLLTELAHLGWTDDAALLAEAAKAPQTTGCAVAGQGAVAGAVAAEGVTKGKAAGLAVSLGAAAGADSPLAVQVPRVTVLPPLPPIAAGKPRVVALAGDSMMAVGIGATLLRQAADHRNLRMVKVFRSGTGLARPEVFNWQDEYPAMLGAEKPDVVIVAIGANDGQGFQVDGKVLPYGTDEWRKVYQARLASYLAMVGAGGARVVWVGLPPMRVPVYDEKIGMINRIAYTVVSQDPQGTWWNPVSYVGDEAGRYREFVTLANGHTLRIRSADGIHLSDEGASLFTTVLMKWLDPPARTAAAMPAAGAVATVPEPSPAAQKTARPRHVALRRNVRRRAEG
jgi:hypothetical protein